MIQNEKCYSKVNEWIAALLRWEFFNAAIFLSLTLFSFFGIFTFFVAIYLLADICFESNLEKKITSDFWKKDSFFVIVLSESNIECKDVIQENEGVANRIAISIENGIVTIFFLFPPTQHKKAYISIMPK